MQKAEESNLLKTEFLQNISHEIRTPMNGILGFSSLLEQDMLEPQKRKKYIQVIQSSCHSLLKTINDIMEISHLETKQISFVNEVFYLNELLHKIRSQFRIKSEAKQVPIYLTTELKDADSQIAMDKSKLNTILSNLIDNALKYTNEGFVELGYQIKHDLLCLYVKDTGIGISEKNKESIFERFAQEEKELSKKQGGLGLGLSIAKENALLLGGDILLESKKGTGSTFWVQLPYNTIENAEVHLEMSNGNDL